MMPLAIDLDGLADLFGDFQLQWTVIAVVLVLLVGLAACSHLRSPVDQHFGGV